MSDVLNGLNLINEGNPIWGGVIISLIFLPMTVYLGCLAINIVFDKKISCCNRVLFLLLLPLLFPLAVALATLAYILCCLRLCQEGRPAWICFNCTIEWKKWRPIWAMGRFDEAPGSSV